MPSSGMGTVIVLFTIVVQNAFPSDKIGVVTAAITFFHEIASARRPCAASAVGRKRQGMPASARPVGSLSRLLYDFPSSWLFRTTGEMEGTVRERLSRGIF